MNNSTDLSNALLKSTQHCFFIRKSFAVTIFLLLFLIPAMASSQSSSKTVTAATFACPPFVISEGEGKYSGLSLILWRQIAKELGLEYQIQEYNLNEMLETVQQGKADIGISCITITPEREKYLDFLHSFYETHLSIAVRQQGYLNAFQAILSNKKLWIGIAVVFGAACLIGGFIFFMEHNINDKLYSMQTTPGKITEAIILGLLFVTRGPIRYYEFKTLTCRILSAILAVVSTLFIASITGLLASALTVEHLSSNIQKPADLVNAKVGALEASTSSRYLKNKGIGYRSYDSVGDMLADLNSGKLDAVVHDAAVLKYLFKKEKATGKYENLLISPYEFGKQNYGFILPENRPYMEQLDWALLKVRRSDEWRKALLDYVNE